MVYNLSRFCFDSDFMQSSLFRIIKTICCVYMEVGEASQQHPRSSQIFNSSSFAVWKFYTEGLYFHNFTAVYVSDLILSSHLVMKLQIDWSSQNVLTVSVFFLGRRSILGDLGHIIKFRKTVNSET